MSFKEDLERGSYGEAVFKYWVSNQGFSVTDVTNNPEYQPKDIDFIVDSIKYEVKTDYWYRRTGNVAVEDKSWFYEFGYVDGWYHYTEADYLVYCIPPQDTSQTYYLGTLFFISLGNLRKLINNHNIPQKVVHDSQKESDVWLVKVEDYFEFFHQEEVYRF